MTRRALVGTLLAVLFLIENEFVTGTTVDVDGGWLLS